jgi:hypothetical protein
MPKHIVADKEEVIIKERLERDDTKRLRIVLDEVRVHSEPRHHSHQLWHVHQSSGGGLEVKDQASIPESR